MNSPPLTAALLASLLAVAAPEPALAQQPPLALEPCRLRGVATEALCGTLARPLNPAEPAGRQIELHVAVLPALARNKRRDPVFMLAGGPGQSAIGLAGWSSGQFARLLNRRDVVLVDQRGVGRSAPLECPEPDPREPLSGRLDTESSARLLAECRGTLEALPHGDLRFYTTTIAMQDLDAVRAALGAERINLVGGSYGTRAALEYARQFPERVRRLVLDGVAPPDMVLPASFSTDNQAALDAMFAHCEADARCRERHPRLAERFRARLAAAPEPVTVVHPITGRRETMELDRDLLLSLVRLPLYAPSLAAALPPAIDAAVGGDLNPLAAMALGMATRRDTRLAMGMHLSVICAEDAPRLATFDGPVGRDYGGLFAELYTRACADWPRGEVPEAFYTVPALAAPALVLSGGADPVTPPRHGERTAAALGPSARHVVVPEAGHGVMTLPCVRDVLFRFIDAEVDAGAAAAAAEQAGCATGIPRPPVFVPPGLEATSAKEGTR